MPKSNNNSKLNDQAIKKHKIDIMTSLQNINKYGSTTIVEHNFGIALDILARDGDSNDVIRLMEIRQSLIAQDIAKYNVTGTSLYNNNMHNNYNTVCNNINNLIFYLIKNVHHDKIIINPNYMQ